MLLVSTRPGYPLFPPNFTRVFPPGKRPRPGALGLDRGLRVLQVGAAFDQRGIDPQREPVAFHRAGQVVVEPVAQPDEVMRPREPGVKADRVEQRTPPHVCPCCLRERHSPQTPCGVLSNGPSVEGGRSICAHHGSMENNDGARSGTTRFRVTLGVVL